MSVTAGMTAVDRIRFRLRIFLRRGFLYGFDYNRLIHIASPPLIRLALTAVSLAGCFTAASDFLS
ncbi:MAG: hypothetical protein WCS21_10015, partial [Lachnospiraceae bacterium]